MRRWDNRPIYEQIMEEYRARIVSGAITPDEKLPSVRELSVALAINLNTIQRAYRELESGGYIYSIPGKGSFAAGRENVDPGRRARLFDKLLEAADELKFLGVNENEIIQVIKGGKRL